MSTSTPTRIHVCLHLCLGVPTCVRVHTYLDPHLSTPVSPCPDPCPRPHLPGSTSVYTCVSMSRPVSVSTSTWILVCLHLCLGVPTRVRVHTYPDPRLSTPVSPCPDLCLRPHLPGSTSVYTCVSVSQPVSVSTSAWILVCLHLCLCPNPCSRPSTFHLHLQRDKYIQIHIIYKCTSLNLSLGAQSRFLYRLLPYFRHLPQRVHVSLTRAWVHVPQRNEGRVSGWYNQSKAARGFSKASGRAPGGAQSLNGQTLAQVVISRSVSLSPASGSVLTAQSQEPASDSVSPSLSAPPWLTFCLSLSKKKHKRKQTEVDQAAS